MTELTQNNETKADLKRESIITTVSWFVLICLTILAVMLDHFKPGRELLIALVFALTVCKGKIVVDIFMGLFAGPKLWRRMMTSYIILVPLITAALYLLS